MWLDCLLPVVPLLLQHGPLPASYHSQPKSSAFEVDVLQFTGGKVCLWSWVLQMGG